MLLGLFVLRLADNDSAFCNTAYITLLVFRSWSVFNLTRF